MNIKVIIIRISDGEKMFSDSNYGTTFFSNFRNGPNCAAAYLVETDTCLVDWANVSVSSGGMSLFQQTDFVKKLVA